MLPARPTSRSVAELLAGTDVAVGTMIGFPHGSHETAAKVFESSPGASADGATELDMVINIGWLRSGEDERVEADIRAVDRGRRTRAGRSSRSSSRTPI